MLSVVLNDLGQCMIVLPKESSCFGGDSGQIILRDSVYRFYVSDVYLGDLDEDSVDKIRKAKSVFLGKLMPDGLKTISSFLFLSCPEKRLL